MIYQVEYKNQNWGCSDIEAASPLDAATIYLQQDSEERWRDYDQIIVSSGVFRVKREFFAMKDLQQPSYPNIRSASDNQAENDNATNMLTPPLPQKVSLVPDKSINIIAIAAAIVTIISVFLPWIGVSSSVSSSVSLPSIGVSSSVSTPYLSSNYSSSSSSGGFSGILVGQGWLILIASVSGIVLLFTRQKFAVIPSALCVLTSAGYMISCMGGSGVMSSNYSSSTFSGQVGINYDIHYGLYMCLISSIVFTAAAAISAFNSNVQVAKTLAATSDAEAVIRDSTTISRNATSAVVVAQSHHNFIADELEKLSELKNQGILTEEEFIQQKAKLLI